MDSFLKSLLPVAVVLLAMWAMTAAYWGRFRPATARYVALVSAGVGIVMAILMGSLGAGFGYFLPIVGYGLGVLGARLAEKEWAGFLPGGWGFVFWMVAVVLGIVMLFARPSIGVVAVLAFFVGNIFAAWLVIPTEEPEPEAGTDDEPAARRTAAAPAAPAKPTVTEASVASAAGAPAAEEEQGRGQEEEPESPARNIRGLRPA